MITLYPCTYHDKNGCVLSYMDIHCFHVRSDYIIFGVDRQTMTLHMIIT